MITTIFLFCFGLWNHYLFTPLRFDFHDILKYCAKHFYVKVVKNKYKEIALLEQIRID